MLTVLHATERDAPKGRNRIDWKLVTDFPVRSRKDAIEKLNWYAMRWKIETFHKILKSGFKAEEVRLGTAERIVNPIAISCILSWRVFWMTMVNRSMPEASPEMALTPTEFGHGRTFSISAKMRFFHPAPLAPRGSLSGLDREAGRASKHQ
jgi:hypothetical protein